MSLEDTSLCMLVNILKELLLNAEPHKCDSLLEQLACEHAIDAGAEPTLGLILHWIDESMRSRQSLFRLASLLIGTIAELNGSQAWRPKVGNFMDKVFSAISEAVTGDRDVCSLSICI